VTFGAGRGVNTESTESAEEGEGEGMEGGMRNTEWGIIV